MKWIAKVLVASGLLLLSAALLVLPQFATSPRQGMSGIQHGSGPAADGRFRPTIRSRRPMPCLPLCNRHSSQRLAFSTPTPPPVASRRFSTRNHATATAIGVRDTAACWIVLSVGTAPVATSACAKRFIPMNRRVRERRPPRSARESCAAMRRPWT